MPRKKSHGYAAAACARAGLAAHRAARVSTSSRSPLPVPIAPKPPAETGSQPPAIDPQPPAIKHEPPAIECGLDDTETAPACLLDGLKECSSMPDEPNEVKTMPEQVLTGVPHDGVDGDKSDNDSAYELEGSELVASLEREVKTVYGELLQAWNSGAWAKAERALPSIRSGRAVRTLREQKQKARIKEQEAAQVRKS
ncbi:hypothetical protein C8T65DRAFT_693377 [Cerioporus squamosus]|nr:hypothetical protein C8T65DRAFT_693377 [Cerioporus squamosus]